jgi:hypothetical protein
MVSAVAKCSSRTILFFIAGSPCSPVQGWWGRRRPMPQAATHQKQALKRPFSRGQPGPQTARPPPSEKIEGWGLPSRPLHDALAALIRCPRTVRACDSKPLSGFQIIVAADFTRSEPAWLPRAQRGQWILVFTWRLGHLDHFLDPGVATHWRIDNKSIGIRIEVLII